MKTGKELQTDNTRSTTHGTHLRLELVGGGFQLIDEDRVVPVTSRKVRILLAILATSRHYRCQRDALATLLWEDVGIESGRSSLRQVLATLRKALAGSSHAMWSDNEFVGFQPDCWQLDVDELLYAATCEDYTGQVPATGIFLQGTNVTEPAISAWLETERQQVNELCLSALDKGMNRALKSGELATATQLGLRSLVIDPLRETVHRQLMRIYDLQGDSVRALRQFRNFRDRLSLELGVPPEAATIELFDRIRQTRRQSPIFARRMDSLCEQERELHRVKSWIDREHDRVLALLEGNRHHRGRVAA